MHLLNSRFLFLLVLLLTLSINSIAAKRFAPGCIYLSETDSINGYVGIESSGSVYRTVSFKKDWGSETIKYDIGSIEGFRRLNRLWTKGNIGATFTQKGQQYFFEIIVDGPIPLLKTYGALWRTRPTTDKINRTWLYYSTLKINGVQELEPMHPLFLGKIMNKLSADVESFPKNLIEGMYHYADLPFLFKILNEHEKFEHDFIIKNTGDTVYGYTLPVYSGTMTVGPIGYVDRSPKYIRFGLDDQRWHQQSMTEISTFKRSGQVYTASPSQKWKNTFVIKEVAGNLVLLKWIGQSEMNDPIMIYYAKNSNEKWKRMTSKSINSMLEFTCKSNNFIVEHAKKGSFCLEDIPYILRRHESED